MIALAEKAKEFSFTVPPRFAYLIGCDKCKCGRIYIGGDRSAALRKADVSSYWTMTEADVLLWRAGLLKFCECEAGAASQRTIEWAVEKMADRVADFQQAAAEAQQRRLERIFDSAQVPPRFAGLTLAGYVKLAGDDPGKRAAIEAVRGYYTNGWVDYHGGKRYGLLLYGKTDQGKTGALCPLFTNYVRAGNSGLWVQYNDLLASLRQFEGGQVEERIAACKHVDYLFIDDFGDPGADRTATDYSRDVLFRILDHRNNYQKATFATSNLHPERMDKQFHERIVKRLAELCAIVEVSGTPMRELMETRGWPA